MDKQNFEKDINVPSKNIEYHNDAKDCEQCSSDSVCCYCKNIACYNLEEQLKNEKHSHEHTKVWIGEYIKKHPYRKEEYEELKAENDNIKETFDGLFKVQYKLADNNKKLRQCLTEIKEIAEINPINTCWTVLELCEKCDKNKECDIQCPFFKFKLILQKISECEVE